MLPFNVTFNTRNMETINTLQYNPKLSIYVTILNQYSS